MFETESPSTDAFQMHSILFFVVSSMFAPTLYHFIQKPRRRSRNALPFKEPTSRKDETAVGRRRVNTVNQQRWVSNRESQG